jgi:hypothetical protein
MRKTRFFLTALLLMTVLMFTGCGNAEADRDPVAGDQSNPSVRQDMDQAADDVREDADDLGNDIKDGVDDAADDVRDAIDGDDNKDDRKEDDKKTDEDRTTTEQ